MSELNKEKSFTDSSIFSVILFLGGAFLAIFLMTGGLSKLDELSTGYGILTGVAAIAAGFGAIALTAYLKK